MQLNLNFPKPWELKAAPAGHRVALLPGKGGASAPEAVVSLGPLLVRPDEPKTWMGLAMTSELPPGARVRLGKQLERKTQDGWPLQLIEAELLGAKDEVLECRIGAFYFFLEHATFAVLRTSDRARLEQHGPAILKLFDTGRPSWQSSEPVCLADAWDLEPKRLLPRLHDSQKGLRSLQSSSALNDGLTQLDHALAMEPTAELHLRQGVILLELARPAEALASFRAALRLDPTSRIAHHHAGTALEDQGQPDAAIAEWQAALKSDPKFVDAHLRLGQALFAQQKFEAALEAFKSALALDPNDLASLRKVIRCHYALGQLDEGVAMRRHFRERLAAGVDPRARLLTEYVYDQFAGDGFFVQALESLQVAGTAFALLSFCAVDAQGRPLPAAFLIETSEQARGAGTPYVLGLKSRAGAKLLGSAKQLPSYPELKAQALALLGEALTRVR